MKRSRIWIIGGGATVLALTSAAAAQETTGYAYDVLGRLVSTNISGGPNNNRQTQTCFDRAGNRSRYDVATTTPAACPTPTPTPSPTP